MPEIASHEEESGAVLRVSTVARTIEIPIGRGLIAIIDEQDAGMVAVSKWHSLKRTDGFGYYAVRNRPTRMDGKFELYLHRAIMRPAVGYEIDHRNGDGLDCRRENLRCASHQQNSQNIRRRALSSSGFKGVRPADKGRWKAYIKLDGRQRHLGVFDAKEDAARAYDAAAVQLFGEFACLNFETEGA